MVTFGNPYDFGGGFGDSAWQPLPFDPTGLLPGGGGVSGNLPGGFTGSICPAGTKCSGPSIALPGGFSGCLGACTSIEGGGGDAGAAVQQACERLGGSYDVMTGQCLGIGEFGGGGQLPEYVPPQLPAPAAGKAVACSTAQCGGRMCAPGKKKCNTTAYVVRDRCTGQYSIAMPGTRCVKGSKSINYANPRAAKRAVRRLEGHHAMLKRTEKALRKLARKR